MARSYWMFVESGENFEITEKMGFTVCGMGRSHRRRAERMQPDDRLLFYVSGIKKWAASATITSRCFVDETPVWNSNSSGEVYPFRVKLSPAIVLKRDDYIDAMILGPRLEYVKRWAPEDWPLAFFDRLHLIPQRDFRLIESEMKRIVSGSRRRSRRNQGRRGNERHGSRFSQPVARAADFAEEGHAHHVVPQQPPEGEGMPTPPPTGDS